MEACRGAGRREESVVVAFVQNAFLVASANFALEVLRGRYIGARSSRSARCRTRCG